MDRIPGITDDHDLTMAEDDCNDGNGEWCSLNGPFILICSELLILVEYFISYFFCTFMENRKL